MLNIDKNYATHSREPFFQIAKNLLDGSTREKVLDIGAGDGTFAEFCERKDFFLFEGNPETVKSLSKRFPNVVEGKLPQLPYEDEFFDVIHMSHVIEHLQPEDVYKTLKEMDRCCKHGGAIVISAPLLWSGFYNDLSHIKPYPPESFVKYLSKVGATATRLLISDKYEVEKTQYRYLPKRSREFEERINHGLKDKILYKLRYNLNKTVRSYELTGYTIVLRKGKR
jgi:ubiquinone/menaquinone biosynthesis C-methylase UbiE